MVSQTLRAGRNALGAVTGNVGGGDFQSDEIARCICAVMSANEHMMIILPAQGVTFPQSIILGYDS